MLRDTKKNFLIDFFFFITVAAIIYVVFRFLAVYLFPFVIGLIITILVQKPAKFISKHTKIKRGICAMALVIFAYIAVGVLIGVLAYVVYTQGYKLAGAVPQFINGLGESLSQIGGKIDNALVNMPDGARESVQNIISNLLTNIGSAAAKWIPGFAASVALNTPEFIVVIIVTIVASCYIAKDLDKLKKFVVGFMNPKYIKLASDIKQIIYKNVFKLIKSYAIIMLITFSELSVGLLILRVQNAVLIAALISLVDVLPVLGSGTVLIPWGIISLLQGNYLLGVGLLVLYVVILIIRNIIEPKIIGGQVGLHPLVTLLAIFIGFRLLGVIGMFTLPIAAIVVLQLYRNGQLDFLHFGENLSDK